MKLHQFVGQLNIKKDLSVHIYNSNIKDTPLDHVMFYGPPGLGKTTLAEAIASALGAEIHQKTGQDLDKEALKNILKNIELGDVFFIDEIHSTPVKTMELLYAPLQIINNLKLNKEELSQFWTEGMNINPFTLIGATTAAGMLAKPLRDRIILSYNFQFYEVSELAEMLIAKECPTNSAKIIAERSRGTPRIALNYFLRMRNELLWEKNITPKKVEEIFNRLEIDRRGYTKVDIAILKYLNENGDTSESSLYRTLSLDISDYKTMYEPFLLQNKMIVITSRGRKITKKGSVYVG